MNAVVFMLHVQVLAYDDEIKERDVGRAYSKYGRGKKCVQNFNREILNEAATWGTRCRWKDE
jgi:hypothetical protein